MSSCSLLPNVFTQFLIKTSSVNSTSVIENQLKYLHPFVSCVCAFSFYSQDRAPVSLNSTIVRNNSSYNTIIHDVKNIYRHKIWSSCIQIL